MPVRMKVTLAVPAFGRLPLCTWHLPVPLVVHDRVAVPSPARLHVPVTSAPETRACVPLCTVIVTNPRQRFDGRAVLDPSRSPTWIGVGCPVIVNVAKGEV